MLCTASARHASAPHPQGVCSSSRGQWRRDLRHASLGRLAPKLRGHALARSTVAFLTIKAICQVQSWMGIRRRWWCQCQQGLWCQRSSGIQGQEPFSKWIQGAGMASWLECSAPGPRATATGVGPGDGRNSSQFGGFAQEAAKKMKRVPTSQKKQIHVKSWYNRVKSWYNRVKYCKTHKKREYLSSLSLETPIWGSLHQGSSGPLSPRSL